MPRSCNVREMGSVSRPSFKAIVPGVGLSVLRWLRRIFQVWGHTVGMAILLGTGMSGLAWIDSDSNRPAQVSGGVELPISPGVVVRSEIIHLWLPESLQELASLQSKSPIVRDYKDLRRFLEHRQWQSLRYAVTIRGHQVNGDHSDTTFIRRPYEDARCFQELLNVLADAGSPTVRDTAAAFPAASVHIISEVLLTRDPSEILTELDRVLEDQW